MNFSYDGLRTTPLTELTLQLGAEYDPEACPKLKQLPRCAKVSEIKILAIYL